MSGKDELTPAIRSVWQEHLLQGGFVRIGRRDWGRFANQMLTVFHFSLMKNANRLFCVDYLVTTPAARSGFQFGRLKQSSGSDLWLESASKEQAESSAKLALQAAVEQAFPTFERHGSPALHAHELRRATLPSLHHQHFAIGISELEAGNFALAVDELEQARLHYEADMVRVNWAAKYRDQVDELLVAMAGGTHVALLDDWSKETLIRYGLQK